MKDPALYIKKIYVENSAKDLPFTEKILSRAPDIPVTVLPDRTQPELDAGPYPQSLHKGKQNLFLSFNRGRFFKACPGTREYRCCDYKVLNIGMNCPMDCVYCILQAYLNNPWLSFFVNIEDLFKELDEEINNTGGSPFLRIGTGEFTDSMALDSLTGLSGLLIESMRDKTSAVLELKTKTASIDHLEKLDHGGRTIMAWSLNAPEIMNREEHRTASLDERLDAAALCASWGYPLAFHFDPIIYHENWEQGYAETIRRLFSRVPRESIVWISMGCLRYIPSLRNIAASRFPSSRFMSEEFVPGLDGKLRYFRSLRTRMYKTLYKLLQEKTASSTCVYLCMESDEIWKDVFGFTPHEKGGLPVMLDRTFST